MIQALVIGGGPAGAGLAARLARAGRDVVLVEREGGPVDKVCGEFLSREAGLYLASLGLDLAALGAVPIEAVRLVARSGHVATVRLPFVATSLSRRVLDEALLGRAAAAGSKVRRGVRVERLIRTQAGWAAHLGDGSSIEAQAAFLATGKHDLNGHKRTAGRQNDLVAFKLHWQLAARQAAELGRYVELVMFDGGYAGLQPVEDGRANLCLVVRRQSLLAHEGRWDRLLVALRAQSAHLHARLTDGTACWPRPLALTAIPYGYVRRYSDGLWYVGDQAAVIPSFSGDGISIALHSADLAAAAYLDGRDANAYQQRLARDVNVQMLLATLLSQGLVRRPAQAVLGAAARLWPGLMSSVAFHTRVSDAALSHGALGRPT